MPMSAYLETHIESLELLGDIEIVEHGRVHRIMVYEYALPFLVQRLQPFHSLARSQSGSHTHIRSAVTAYESPTVLFKVEMFITEDLQKGVATAL